MLRAHSSTHRLAPLVLLSFAAARCALPHAPVRGDDGGPVSDIVSADHDASVLPDGSPMDVRDSMPGMDVVDSGVEPTTEAGMEAGPEAGMDAGMEAGVEAGMEAGPDAGPEAGMEAGPDAGPDVIDAAMDARDTGVDTGVVTDTGGVTDTGVVRPTRCAEVPMALRGSAVQTLYYRPMLDRTWQAYCDFSTAGGPWTLVAKVDPGQTEWDYDNARWTDGSVVNESSTNLMRSSAKFRGFSEISFTSMRLDFVTDQSGIGTGPWDPNSITFAFDSGTRPLNDVLNGADNQLITGTTRANWLAVIPTVAVLFNSQLQPNCNRVAFNNVSSGGGMGFRVRIGILGNNENDCNSCDSWIGAGTNPSSFSGATVTAGNRNPDDSSTPLANEERRTPSWVFIWVR